MRSITAGILLLLATGTAAAETVLFETYTVGNGVLCLTQIEAKAVAYSGLLPEEVRTRIPGCLVIREKDDIQTRKVKVTLIEEIVRGNEIIPLVRFDFLEVIAPSRYGFLKARKRSDA